MMRLARACGGLLVVALGVASGAGQQPEQKPDMPRAEKKDPQSTVEPRSGPGAGQKFLEKFVGDWDVAKAFYPRGGGEPARSKGTCKQAMIHDGRFLQSDFTFGDGAAKTTGLGLIGYDASTGRFTSVWTDSRQTRMSFRQGREKFDGEQIVLHAEGLGDTKEVRQSKTVTKLEDKGSRIIHRQYSTAADGTDRLVMELVMTRKPAAAK
jgi:hypothetical protein